MNAETIPAFVGCLDAGGPMFKISVGGRVFEFELNQFAGPNVLDSKGRPFEDQPTGFLLAASLWIQQGKRMEGGLCRWDHEPVPIKRHLGGKHWLLVGHEPAVRGS